MIAFIASSTNMARIDIARDYELTGINRGVIKLDGIETLFIIVTEPREFNGIRLTDYHFVRSFRGSWYKMNMMRSHAQARLAP